MHFNDEHLSFSLFNDLTNLFSSLSLQVRKWLKLRSMLLCKARRMKMAVWTMRVSSDPFIVSLHINHSKNSIMTDRFIEIILVCCPVILTWTFFQSLHSEQLSSNTSCLCKKLWGSWSISPDSMMSGHPRNVSKNQLRNG